MSYLAPQSISGRRYLAPRNEPVADNSQQPVNLAGLKLLAPAAINGRAFFASPSPASAPTAPPVVVGGGGGPVREVRAYADQLDRARKPTRSEKRKRRQALEAEALGLLPDLPEAEKLAPLAARIVFEQEARALAPLYAQRPIQALAPVPFDAHAALRDLVARLAAEAELAHAQHAEDEFDVELLMLGS